MKHLRSIDEAGVENVRRLLSITAHMAEVNRRPNPIVPALRGRTVCNLFFEDSTRTRLSFEAAERRLSAIPMSVAVSSSSVNKGESLRDTVETIAAVGVDAFVIRHKSSGAPWLVSQWTDAAIINAGDGWANHPTQALIDAYTAAESLGRLDAGVVDLSGVHVGIVGDVKHSRVARSDIEIFTALGARVSLIGPSTLMPPSVEGYDVDVTTRFDEVIGDLDVVYLLRMQRERMTESLVPSLREYTTRFALTPERVDRLRPDAIVMHPGPMNRGVEILVDPGSLTAAKVLDQVRNGVAVRMAVLFDLLGSGEINE